MNIDLNSADYNAKEGKAIFNNGDAGLVDNVTVSITKKKPEDKENAPAYNLVFTDAEGGEARTSFWYVDKPTDYATAEELLKKQATIMKHILHAIYGTDYKFPALPGDSHGFLDGCMKLIRDGLQSGLKFRIFANYGTPDYPKSFIQARSWVPFMESANVAFTETRLVVSKTDNMIRLTQDSTGTSDTKAAAQSLVDDWE